ncbi:MAG TPA: ABC transporter ATP-binding protein [Gemmataceae bacterium]|nr:ABC transporter ATP-binding protein [Gemmataceae bacterium]
MSFFETRQLCKYFRRGTKSEVRALDGVSLSISQGSFTVLRGPSGSGKTTLLALLGALERPSGGEVLFDGRELTRCSDVELARLRRRMGFVFQNFSLIPSLPVWENITYPLIPRGVRSGARLELAKSLLVRFGLIDKLLAKPQELSGGEQQRVAVARALAGQPEVILADEPTSNLDPAAAQTLVSSIQAIHAEGKTVVVASHDPQFSALATQVYELENGRLKTTSS